MEAATAGRVSGCVERFHGEATDRYRLAMVEESKLLGTARLWFLGVDVCRATRCAFDLHQAIRMVAVCVGQQDRGWLDTGFFHLLQHIIWMGGGVNDGSLVGRFANQ